MKKCLPHEWLESRDICPACCSEGAIEIYREPYSSFALMTRMQSFYGRKDWAWLEDCFFIVDYCPVCTLSYQRWVLKPEAAAWFYAEIVDSRAKKGKEIFPPANEEASRCYLLGELVSWLINRDIQQQKDPSFSPAEWRFLDYGCGYCEWATTVKNHGIQSFGFDISDHAKKRASQLGIHFIEGASGFDKTKYTVVMLNRCLSM